HQYLVGERVTLADISVVTSLHNGFKFVFDRTFRNEYPAVTRWFTTIVNQPNFKAVAGEFDFCETTKKYTVAPKERKGDKKPKEATKPKAKAKEPKELKDDDEEEESFQDTPKPKSKLDLLPAAKMPLDEWKRQYSNNDTSVATKWLWENIDLTTDFSIWKVDYKYNDELTKIYMSNNLAGGLINRLERARKYAFGCLVVAGEDNANVITGYFIVRGVAEEMIEEITDAADYDSYDWVKVNDVNAAEKSKIDQIFAWEGMVDDVESRAYLKSNKQDLYMADEHQNWCLSSLNPKQIQILGQAWMVYQGVPPTLTLEWIAKLIDCEYEIVRYWFHCRQNFDEIDNVMAESSDTVVSLPDANHWHELYDFSRKRSHKDTTTAINTNNSKRQTRPSPKTKPPSDTSASARQTPAKTQDTRASGQSRKRGKKPTQEPPDDGDQIDRDCGHGNEDDQAPVPITRKKRRASSVKVSETAIQCAKVNPIASADIASRQTTPKCVSIAEDVATKNVAMEGIVTEEVRHVVFAEEVAMEGIVTEDVKDVVIKQVIAEEVVNEQIVTKQIVKEQIVTEQVVAEQIVTEQVVTKEAGTEEAGAEQVIAEEAGAEQVVTEEAVATTITNGRYSTSDLKNIIVTVEIPARLRKSIPLTPPPITAIDLAMDMVPDAENEQLSAETYQRVTPTAAENKRKQASPAAVMPLSEDDQDRPKYRRALPRIASKAKGISCSTFVPLSRRAKQAKSADVRIASCNSSRSVSMDVDESVMPSVAMPSLDEPNDGSRSGSTTSTEKEESPVASVEGQPRTIVRRRVRPRAPKRSVTSKDSITREASCDDFPMGDAMPIAENSSNGRISSTESMPLSVVIPSFDNNQLASKDKPANSDKRTVRTDILLSPLTVTPPQEREISDLQKITHPDSEEKEQATSTSPVESSNSKQVNHEDGEAIKSFFDMISGKSGSANNSPVRQSPARKTTTQRLEVNESIITKPLVSEPFAAIRIKKKSKESPTSSTPTTPQSQSNTGSNERSTQEQAQPDDSGPSRKDNQDCEYAIDLTADALSDLEDEPEKPPSVERPKHVPIVHQLPAKPPAITLEEYAKTKAIQKQKNKSPSAQTAETTQLNNPGLAKTLYKQTKKPGVSQSGQKKLSKPVYIKTHPTQSRPVFTKTHLTKSNHVTINTLPMQGMLPQAVMADHGQRTSPISVMSEPIQDTLPMSFVAEHAQSLSPRFFASDSMQLRSPGQRMSPISFMAEQMHGRSFGQSMSPSFYVAEQMQNTPPGFVGHGQHQRRLSGFSNPEKMHSEALDSSNNEHDRNESPGFSITDEGGIVIHRKQNVPRRKSDTDSNANGMLSAFGYGDMSFYEQSNGSHYSQANPIHFQLGNAVVYQQGNPSHFQLGNGNPSLYNQGNHPLYQQQGNGYSPAYQQSNANVSPFHLANVTPYQQGNVTPFRQGSVTPFQQVNASPFHHGNTPVYPQSSGTSSAYQNSGGNPIVYQQGNGSPPHYQQGNLSFYEHSNPRFYVQQQGIGSSPEKQVDVALHEQKSGSAGHGGHPDPYQQVHQEFVPEKMASPSCDLVLEDYDPDKVYQGIRGQNQSQKTVTAMTPTTIPSMTPATISSMTPTTISSMIPTTTPTLIPKAISSETPKNIPTTRKKMSKTTPKTPQTQTQTRDQEESQAQGPRKHSSSERGMGNGRIQKKEQQFQASVLVQKLEQTLAQDRSSPQIHRHRHERRRARDSESDSDF
ncbi:hypothetical protein BG004_006817, partial [Podila humilis]